MVWQSPGLPGWRKINFITVTRKPHHPDIAASLYCHPMVAWDKSSLFFLAHNTFISRFAKGQKPLTFHIYYFIRVLTRANPFHEISLIMNILS